MGPTDRAQGPGALRRGSSDRLFRLDLPFKNAIARGLSAASAPLLERVLGLDDVNAIYDAVRGQPTGAAFVRASLEELGVRAQASDDDLAKVPKSGPCVVVANHPFGAVEGLALAEVMLRVRPDVKVMANFLLARIPQLHESFIFVDPFGGHVSRERNLRPLRDAIAWLRGGGMLVVFPAGEVSSLRPMRRCISDPVWSPTVAKLIRRANAAALPVFFDGRNSSLFQCAGLIHPRLRTALLVREMLAKRGKTLRCTIATAIPARRLQGFASDGQMTAFLRQRTYVLRHRGAAAGLAAGGGEAASGPGGNVVKPSIENARRERVVPPTDPAALAAEIEGLPTDHRLVEQDDLVVYRATAERVPAVMHEIGRLREITFRATGEGTGKPIDLDAYDDYYLQLFIWNARKREIVGGYRLGHADVILRERGRSGLYTHSLFQYERKLLDAINPALEMGRSFVRAEYQRSFSPLLLLWRGIGRVVADHPQYKMLFGPVSISNTYQSVSRQLMVRFLMASHGMPDFAGWVKPRNPFRLRPLPDVDAVLPGNDDGGDELSDLVAAVEPDAKGLPVLIRQYLKLGAKLLAFNVDRDFGDCVDGLILVDLTKTDRKLLDRYLGKDGAARFLAYHAQENLNVPRRPVQAASTAD